MSQSVSKETTFLEKFALYYFSRSDAKFKLYLKCGVKSHAALFLDQTGGGQCIREVMSISAVCRTNL